MRKITAVKTIAYFTLLVFSIFCQTSAAQTYKNAKAVKPHVSVNLIDPNRLVQLVHRLKEKAPLKSLSAWIRLSITHKDQENSYEGAFLIQSPDQFHLEILDDLGQTHLRVIANGKKVYWWNAEKNKSKLLKQNEKVLKKIFRLPLSLSDLTETLLQKYSLQNLEKAYEFLDTEKFISLQFPKKIIHLNPKNLKRKALLVFKKKKQKKLQYKLNYQWKEALHSSEDKYYPKKLIWTFHQAKVKVEFEFKSIEINPKLSEEKFDLSRWSSK